MSLRKLLASELLVDPLPVLPTGADINRTTATTQLPYTTVTSGGSANTDGSWTTVVSSVSVDGAGMWLTNSTIGQSGVDTTALMDIALGPSGSPTVLIEDLQVGALLGSGNGLTSGMILPIRVPEGSDIIARVRCATASRNFPILIDVYGDGYARSFDQCTTYGAVAASSTGTTLTAPGASNSKGAWTQLAASTSAPILGIGVGPISNWTPGYSNAEFMVDIGYGAAASEVTVVENYYFQSFSSETVGQEWPWGRFIPMARPIPAGSRLVARYQQSGGTSGANLIVYGYS